MPPKPQKEIIYPILSDEQWNQIVNPENKKLAVVDVHLGWCGPCQVMTSNYRTLFFSFEEAEKRIEFWTIENTLLPIELSSRLQISCKPKFLIFLVRYTHDNSYFKLKEGELKAEIDGADYTKIETVVNTHIPSLDE